MGTSAWALLLQPQGKVVAFLRLHPDRRRGVRPRHRRRVGAGRGRAAQPVQAAGEGRHRGAGGGGAWPCGARAPTRRCPTAAAGRLAGPARASTWSVPAADGCRPPACRSCSVDDYEVARIEAGVPVMGRELDESTIPAEAGVVDRVGELHQGLLHRPGAGGPHRLPGRQRPPPAAGRGGGRRRPVPPVGAAVHADGKDVGVLTSVAPARSGWARRWPWPTCGGRSSRRPRSSCAGKAAPPPARVLALPLVP